MDVPASLNRKRWKELLDGVRGKLGEGEISRLSLWPRYRCRTSGGRPFLLALGSWPLFDEDERCLFPYVEAEADTSFPGSIRLGAYGATLSGVSRRWKEVTGLQPEFVSRYKPVCTDQAFGRSFLSERTQSVIDDLEGIPPRGITVVVNKRSLLAYKMSTVLSVDSLARFVTVGMELADLVL